MPLFTIGVTTYDRVELLIETLTSITGQTFHDFEVIVANDNPERKLSPESLGITDSRISFINNPENLGEFGNLNSLLKVARGRYFTWLADDDLYAPSFLQAAYDAIITNGYPPCVFTSFLDIHDSQLPINREIRAEDARVFEGPEFLRLYLAGELKAIGVMGVFDREALLRTGGLEDISADGKGFYCEYMLLIRAGLLEKIVYVNVPLVFFRLNPEAWRITCTDLDQYKRAGLNLVRNSLVCFTDERLVVDFDQNLTNLLKFLMSEFVTASRRVRPFRIPQLTAYLLFAGNYIRPLLNTRMYRKSHWCLLKAEVWLISILFKQAFLAFAPANVIKLAYWIRALQHRDKFPLPLQFKEDPSV